jgi:4a-hydroxytetrahydrobiopterin dehydratase
LETDPVRNILLAILARVKTQHDLVVLPILVANASRPNPEHLDEELRPIFDSPCYEIRNPEKVGEFSVIRSVLFRTKLFKSAPPPVITPVMTKPPKELSKEEEQAFFEKHDQWVIQESPIPNNLSETMREMYRLYEFLNYEDAFRFLKLVDEHGIRPHNHHPRIQNTYNRVEIWLCTFNIGYQLTYRDLRLARICEGIFLNYMDIK